jgi:homoserine kinase
MTPRSVKTFAPGSISNLGPGFDILGVAVRTPGDYVVASRQKERGLCFTLQTTQPRVPDNPQENVAAYVGRLMLEEFKPRFGIHLTLHKLMPIGSGLGSSAASSVAAAMAVNALLPKPLKKADLLRFALEGERIASGSLHGDNAAPSLLGGGCLIRSYDPLDVIPVPIDRSLVWIVVHPHVVVLTKKARTIMPRNIPIRSAIHQWGNVAGLILGLGQGDGSLLRRSVEDVIAEPVRAQFIPGFHEVKKAALGAGGFGCSVSGSGPSMFSIASSMHGAHAIGAAMARAFQQSAGVRSDVFISCTNEQGARVIWRKNK